jgi:hypothetical protein
VARVVDAERGPDDALLKAFKILRDEICKMKSSGQSCTS